MKLIFLFLLISLSFSYARAQERTPPDIKERVAAINCNEIPNSNREGNETILHVGMSNFENDFDLCLNTSGHSLSYSQGHRAFDLIREISETAQFSFWGKIISVREYGDNLVVLTRNQAGEVRLTINRINGGTRVEAMSRYYRYNISHFKQHPSQIDLMRMDFVDIPNRGVFCEVKISNSPLRTIGGKFLKEEI